MKGFQNFDTHEDNNAIEEIYNNFEFDCGFLSIEEKLDLIISYITHQLEKHGDMVKSITIRNAVSIPIMAQIVNSLSRYQGNWYYFRAYMFITALKYGCQWTYYSNQYGEHVFHLFYNEKHILPFNKESLRELMHLYQITREL